MIAERQAPFPAGLFSAATAAWLRENFAAPTPVQAAGWPVVAGGAHALMIAPTGAGESAPEHAPSWYAATAGAARRRPPLRGETHADVCVIGAGFSGLAAALHLAGAGFDVVVLEAERVGWGASGRNGGLLVNGYSCDLDVIERRYGGAAAAALGGMAFEGAAIVRALIDRHGIDCDYRAGGVAAALTHRQMAELETLARIWQRCGHTGLRLLDRDGVRGHVRTQRYVGGLLDEWAGHLHPLKLAAGEARALEALGGRIFERSRVHALERGAAPAVHTAAGSVRAKHVVLCGNAYLGGLVPALAKKIVPVGAPVIATAPLGAATARRLMPTGVCVEDWRYILDYYRMTADHRLLFGGGLARGEPSAAAIARRLRPHLARLFPALANVRIDYAWTGKVAITLTGCPHLGRLDGNIFFAHGYSGHGVSTTHLAGRLIAEAIGGRPARFDAFAALPSHALPGGRLLRLAFTYLAPWYYRARDKLGL